MDHFLADMRFLEPGWREVFRARMSGWLPQEWIRDGVRTGSIIVVGGDQPMLKLSELGHRLTDLAGPSLSEETIEQLATALVGHDWDRAWLSPEGGTRVVLLDRADMFPDIYREKIMLAFDHMLGAAV